MSDGNPAKRWATLLGVPTAPDVEQLAAAADAGSFSEDGVRAVLRVVAEVQREAHVRTFKTRMRYIEPDDSFLYDRWVHASPSVAAALNERIADRITASPELMADPGLKFVPSFTGVAADGANRRRAHASGRTMEQRGAMDAGHLAIYCADIGSVKNAKFGWAVVCDGQQRCGRDIGELVDDVVQSLATECKVALGFECPLWVPVSDDPAGLTSGRTVDGNKPWSAGAGTSALAAGLTETAWILREVRRRLRHKRVSLPTAYLDWDEFLGSNNGIFLWEAFVSGEAKYAGTDHCQHIADALTACREFAEGLPAMATGDVSEPPHEVRSLIGSALLWSGWSQDLDLLRAKCLVVRPTRPHVWACPTAEMAAGPS